jgi:serine/threonine-protein kinase
MDGGKTRPLHSDPGLYSDPRFSPDGKRLAFVMAKKQGATDIWIEDLEQGSSSRLTILPGLNANPTWTPDGKSIVFQSVTPESTVLYSIRADGSGEPRTLTSAKGRLLPYSFTPNGKRLIGSRPLPTGGVDLWIASFEGEGESPRLGQLEPLVESFAIKLFPALSPDGRWLAYTSNESGRSEIYVRPFPGLGGVRQVSTGGGTRAMWSHRGRELFFVAQDGRIMVVNYSTKGDAFVFGKPRVWSEKRIFFGGPMSGCDLAPDDKRFAVMLYPDGSVEQKPVTHVTFLLNFFDYLKQRVPGGRE